MEGQKRYYNQSISKNLDESGCKPNTIWVDRGSVFYNGSVKSWLHDSGIEMYST